MAPLVVDQLQRVIEFGDDVFINKSGICNRCVVCENLGLCPLHGIIYGN